MGRWKHLKQKKPDLIIGVGGCVASQEGAEIGRRAPYVDLVFGPQTLHRLPEMMAQRGPAGTIVVDVSFPEIEKFDNLPEPRAEGPSAFVSVMEGCSKYCTFCVVPYTRGEEVSRPLDDVIAEIAHLADGGVKEVNLLGQNVNAYRGESHTGEIVDFAELLHVVARIGGIERIRYTTSHPVEFSDALIDAYAEIPQMVDSPAPARPERFRPHSDGHEAGPHCPGVQVKNPPPAHDPPQYQYLVGFHCGLPR